MQGVPVAAEDADDSAGPVEDLEPVDLEPVHGREGVLERVVRPAHEDAAPHQARDLDRAEPVGATSAGERDVALEEADHALVVDDGNGVEARVPHPRARAASALSSQATATAPGRMWSRTRPVRDMRFDPPRRRSREGHHLQYHYLVNRYVCACSSNPERRARVGGRESPTRRADAACGPSRQARTAWGVLC